MILTVTLGCFTVQAFSFSSNSALHVRQKESLEKRKERILYRLSGGKKPFINAITLSFAHVPKPSSSPVTLSRRPDMMSGLSESALLFGIKKGR